MSSRLPVSPADTHLDEQSATASKNTSAAPAGLPPSQPAAPKQAAERASQAAQMPHQRQATQRRQFVVGIDLGGTSVKVGLLQDRQLIARCNFSTADCQHPKDVFRQAQSFASEHLAAHHANLDDVHAVGLAMAGVIDDATATLMETANLHDWHGIEFLYALGEVFDKPVAVVNDANAAALGEFYYGDHRGDSLTLLTLGTGIGGGIILGGQPLNGNHGCGGEIGHITIDHGPQARMCGCGKPGHLEAYAGAAGIVQTATELLTATDQPSLLRELDQFSPVNLWQAAEQNDAIALQTIQQTAIYLGRAIAILSQIADPAVVLLGGAVTFGGVDSPTGKRFLQWISDEMLQRSLVQSGTKLMIDFATLGNDAGMLGAAQHALQSARPLRPPTGP